MSQTVEWIELARGCARTFRGRSERGRVRSAARALGHAVLEERPDGMPGLPHVVITPLPGAPALHLLQPASTNRPHLWAWRCRTVVGAEVSGARRPDGGRP